MGGKARVGVTGLVGGLAGRDSGGFPKTAPQASLGLTFTCPSLVPTGVCSSLARTQRSDGAQG